MSLITVVATHKYVSFMSDGRLTNNEGISVDEHYKKILKVNDEIIIGAAGNHHQAYTLFKHAESWSKTVKGDIEMFVDTMLNWMQTTIPKTLYPNINLHVAVGGITKSRKIAVYCFNNNERCKINYKYLVLKGDITYLVLGDPNATTGIRYLVNKYKNCSLEQIIDIQKKVNIEISKKDSTVNNSTFNEFISL